MKILWHSTAPWGPSSYSVLTKRTVPNIVLDGHNVVVNCWYGLQGERQNWTIKGEDSETQVAILPQVVGDNYGTKSFLPVYRMLNADVGISVMDVWVLPAKVTGQMNFAPWFPIDHDPAPPQVVKALQTAMYPMCYSKWGVEVLKQKHNLEAHYVPCSADTKVFKPMDKAQARKDLGLPDPDKFGLKAKDIFLVSMVAANKDPQDRKGYSESLQAFARFVKSHPEARLYLHTNWGGAMNIAQMIVSLGIEDYVIKPDDIPLLMGGFNEGYMKRLYNASDLLLSPSKSEGFGLPMLEAQMCGCPVAASAFSTTDELLSAGWKIDGQLHWTVGAESWRYIVYIDSVVEALEAAYADRDNKKLRQKARRGVRKYDTNLVHNQYWRPALKDISKLVEDGGKLQIDLNGRNPVFEQQLKEAGLEPEAA